jgi:tripeptidyl-peptidase-1
MSKSPVLIKFNGPEQFHRYYIPAHLTEHIDYITPGLKLTPVVKRTVQEKRIVQAANKSKNVPKKVSALVHDFYYKSPLAGMLPDALQGCGVNITVACWRALYGIPGALPKSSEGNSLGLFEQGDYFAESDIDEYLAEFASHVPQGTYPISATIDGADYSELANNTDLVGGEANIDIDIA